MEPSRTLERLGYKLYPQSINAYYRCPRKFHFRYIRNVRMPFEFKPPLVIGGVTHKVLAAIFRDRRDHRDGPGSTHCYTSKPIMTHPRHQCLERNTMQKVTIVGLGLIGSSIGLGLRRWASNEGKRTAVLR